jgi:endonuclease/exonuclease/phosphatase family metal-dependent hydrolase
VTVNFRGFTACESLAEWLPWVEKLMLHRRIIQHNIDIFQLIGNASASATTHSKGGAFDVLQATWGALEIYRQAGADASWRRTPAQGFTLHAHGVLRGCPHNSPARYQMDAVDDGYNGLGLGGRSGRDDGPRPLSKRTWQQGIEWIKGQLGVAVVVPPPLVSTVWDHTHWNVASMKPGWFSVPWTDRQAQIGATLKNADSSVITLNETHYKQQTADILTALGSSYWHQSSPVGNDMMIQNVWDKDPNYTYKEYPLGAQNRYTGVLHLVRKATGFKLTVVNTHFPYGDAGARRVAANNLVDLLQDVDGPIALAGDWNNEAFASGTPHQILRNAGYEWMREQAAITNGSQPEFPKQGKWLCDIATDKDRRNGAIRITSGAVLLTSSRLSDHRPLKTRMQTR